MQALSFRARSGSAVEQHVRRVLDRSVDLRMPELFVQPRGSLYHLPDRHGVTAIALRTSSLSEKQLSHIMSYRLAQYVLANLIDRDVLFERQIESEPLSSVSPDDIHVLAGEPEHGQIYCYAVLRAIGTASNAAALNTRDRPLFPVEQIFGWGIFNHLPSLSSLPINRVLELSRFVKNHQAGGLGDRGVRSPIEVCVALHHVLCGPLFQTVDAVVGDVEEQGAKRHLDLFHVPATMIRSRWPCSVEDADLYQVLRHRRFYPFAFMVADLALQRSRLAAIEQALALPGDQAVRALCALKRTAQSPRSRLEPPVERGHAIRKYPLEG